MTEQRIQPEVNIGMVGHVDHGKTTLVKALTGVWTSRHSEELRRGMTIKLGYADGDVYFCEDCEPPACYTPFPACEQCPESVPKLVRRLSYVDAPGHEVLMATMLSGAALMDGAILVIAANEPCPQPQTAEHFTALQIVGIRNIVIVQNKVDVVPREKAYENYLQIKKMVEGTFAEGAPIIPVSALKGVNIDALLMAVEERIPTPERDLSKPPLMYVARSFDVNKPGTPPDKLKGGVVGGTLIHGVLRVGDEIAILPGARVRTASGATVYEPLRTAIVSLRFSELEVNEARPGGLLAVGTELDPSLTKADGLVGNVVTTNERLVEVVDNLKIRYSLLERVVGVKELMRVEPLRLKENIVLTVGTAITLGVVTRVTKDTLEVQLRSPVAITGKDRVAISRQVLGRWRLVGWGVVE